MYANKSEDDIICRDIFDDFEKKHSNFKVHYVVDKATSKNWKGGESSLVCLLGPCRPQGSRI